MNRTPQAPPSFWFLIIWAAIALCLVSAHAFADPALIETRCCTVPARDATGKIKRRDDVLAAFAKIHPCPSTGMRAVKCPGWNLDHVFPLADGYFDAVSNLQWLPVVLKSGAGKYPKDRWERKINATPQILVPMPISGLLVVQ